MKTIHLDILNEEWRRLRMIALKDGYMTIKALVEHLLREKLEKEGK